MTSKVAIGRGAVLAALLAAGLAASAAGASAAGAAGAGAARAQTAGAGHGTVAACRDYGESAIRRHVTVTWIPAACRGLSRAEVNQAVAGAIGAVSGRRPKAARRRLAGLVAPELAFLIRAPLSAAAPVRVPAYVPGAPVARRARPRNTGLDLAALLAWILTAGSGSYLVARWLVAGGRLRGGGAPSAAPPGTVVAHFGLALAGLVLWVVFLLVGWPVLAWTAGALLVPVAGLGMGLVTVGMPAGLTRRAAVTGRASSANGSNGANSANGAGGAGRANGIGGPNGAGRPGLAGWRSMAAEPGEGRPGRARPGEWPLVNGPAGNGLAGNGLAGNGLAGNGLAGNGLAGNGPAVNGSSMAAMPSGAGRPTATALRPPPAPAVRPTSRRGRIPVLVVAGHGVLAAATLFLVLLAAVGAGGAF